MPSAQPRYSKEEFSRRGEEFYDRKVRPHIVEGDKGKFVAIDIETGDYEIDADELAASDRLLEHHHNAQVWLIRVGSRYVRRFGLQRVLAEA
ncbi:MAG: hypothetical protein HYU30_08430 [Chloroflexi bacterium]|nr:hypothetical protein [Chloroflexota bacterium]